MSIGYFVKYNNAIPVVLMLVLLATGTVAAANPDIRQGVTRSVYDEEQTVISIDNTYLVDKNLKQYTPKIKILTVTEDTDYYFVQYRFTTIELADHVWQDIDTEREMTVAKSQLGNRDLGLYVTNQLAEIIDRELARLRNTQEFEKKNVSQKKVATAYKGLVGKFLDDKTETLPGYKPVIPEPKAAPKEPPKPIPTPPAPIPVPTPEVPEPEIAGASSSTASTTDPDADIEAPTIQILGDNPARVRVGESYTDLGAVVTDNREGELSYEIFVDNISVESVVIDTASIGTFTITYIGTDTAGNQAREDRIVEVYEETSSGGGGGGSTPNTTGSSTSSSTHPTPEPPTEESTGSTTEENIEPEEPPTPPASTTPPVPQPSLPPTSSPPTSTPTSEPEPEPEHTDEEAITDSEESEAPSPPPLPPTSPVATSTP